MHKLNIIYNNKQKEKGYLKMEDKKLVTILVPAYNEKDVLNMLYERLANIMEC